MHANIPLLALCAGVAFAGPILRRQAPTPPGQAGDHRAYFPDQPTLPQGVPTNPNALSPGAHPRPLTPGGASSATSSRSKKSPGGNAPRLPADLQAGNDHLGSLDDPSLYPGSAAPDPRTLGKLPKDNAAPYDDVQYEQMVRSANRQDQRNQPVPGSGASNPAAREIEYQRPAGRTGPTNNANHQGVPPTGNNQYQALEEMMRQRGQASPNAGGDRLDPAMFNGVSNGAGPGRVGGLGPNQGQEVAMDIMPTPPTNLRCPAQTRCVQRIQAQYARPDCLASERHKAGCSTEIQSAFDSCSRLFCPGDSEAALKANTNANRVSRVIPKPNRDTATGKKPGAPGFSLGAATGPGAVTGPSAYTGPGAGTGPGGVTGPNAVTYGSDQPENPPPTAQQDGGDASEDVSDIQEGLPQDPDAAAAAAAGLDGVPPEVLRQMQQEMLLEQQQQQQR
ncbi:MAG: hypothetical protein M1816_001627 [Peltula sp. TS41687]|nr:MAG: hypothetical protein M1816_001627 [Peltula sp. TS41687]